MLIEGKRSAHLDCYNGSMCEVNVRRLELLRVCCGRNYHKDEEDSMDDFK